MTCSYTCIVSTVQKKMTICKEDDCWLHQNSIKFQIPIGSKAVGLSLDI